MQSIPPKIFSVKTENAFEQADIPINSIIYCHGFASNFDPRKDKVRTLSRLAPVHGVTVDYTRSPEEVFERFATIIAAQEKPLIVGTSMGGFYAAWLGSELDLPFIAINPAISPATSLQKYIGDGMTHFGTPFRLELDIVAAYRDLPFRLDGKGMVIIDLDDDVIDAKETIALADSRIPLVAFEGGSHRFDHMDELAKILEINFQWTCLNPPTEGSS